MNRRQFLKSVPVVAIGGTASVLLWPSLSKATIHTKELVSESLYYATDPGSNSPGGVFCKLVYSGQDWQWELLQSCKQKCPQFTTNDVKPFKLKWSKLNV